MLDENQEIQFQILSALAKSSSPKGAGALQVDIKREGVHRSEAAIGRTLRHFQEEKWVEKKGFQGHVITREGLKQYESLRLERHRRECAQDILEQIKSGEFDVFMDLLHARRAIEREAARLVAAEASEEEIGILGQNISLQKEAIDRKRTNVPFNKEFHELLVQFSHNDILKSMYQLVKMDSDWANLFEEIQKRRGSKLGVGHFRIFEALCRRDPDAADQAAASHIDSIIDDAKEVLAGFKD